MPLLSNIIMNMTTVITVMEHGYSPVALAHEWSKVSRLLVVLIFACFGTLLNGFFFASFFVEPTLNRIGYVFMACMGVSDLVITSGVLPAVAMVLLSDQWDDVYLCHYLQFFVEAASYAYNLFFAVSRCFSSLLTSTRCIFLIFCPQLLATESYYRLCRSIGDYEWFISMRIGFLGTSVYTISLSAAAVGVLLDLDYDYCERKKYGNYDYRLLTSILFFAIPAAITFFGLFSSMFGFARRVHSSAHYRRSEQSDIDCSTCIVNVVNYIIYILCWTPYLITIYVHPDTDDATFYQQAWVGICRSVFPAFLYAIFVKNFRRAFANICKYCICKYAPADTFSIHHIGGVEYKVATGDVRVHLLAPTTRPSTPLEIATASHEVTDL